MIAAIMVLMTVALVGNGFWRQETLAAELYAASDSVSSHQPGAKSNHTISFKTPSGVHAPASSITIGFALDFNVSGLDFSDLDLTHGPISGSETSEALAAAAGVNVWGAFFAGNVLFLMPPTNAGINEIAPSDTVILGIGSQTDTGANDIENPAVVGSYDVLIAGDFGDGKTISVAIADTTVSVGSTVVESGSGIYGDTTPPIISDVEVINITPYAATITWVTNEAANSRVEYGLDRAHDAVSVFNGSFVVSHSIDLMNLKPDTVYYFQIISLDQSGNQAIAGNLSFTTLPEVEELFVYNIRVRNITAHSADVLWESNREADSRVDFGLTEEAETGFFYDEAFVREHVIHLNGLRAETKYYFNVTSEDEFKNEVTGTGHYFTTKSEELFVPNVKNFDAKSDVENYRAILTWENPIYPEFHGVTIKRSLAGYPAYPSEGDFVYGGAAQIAYDNNLALGVIYYYSAFAYDGSGNFSSGAFSWTILIPKHYLTIKAKPEKRVPKIGNWDTSAVVTFKTPGENFSSNLYLVETNAQGEADLVIDDLIPGIYDSTFKGLSHLKKKLYGLDIRINGNNFLDFTQGDTFHLLAGDVQRSKDNYVNGLDIAAMENNIYTGDVDVDLNQDYVVNGLDFSVLSANFYKWGD